jgi:RNA polymerase sigma-70 factor (ECF subfamily)
MMISDDLTIINQVLSGNTGVFSNLVEKYKDMVFSLIIKIVHNREEAEEVAQDTFLKAYHHLGNFKNESKFSTWLFRIAYNTAISRTRKKSLITSVIDDHVVENYSVDSLRENIENSDDLEDKIMMMKMIIADLPQDDQLLMNLFYFNKQSVEEIGLITSLTESNVKVKLHRIRKRIYTIMQERMGVREIKD